jgi:hypothetical protein
MEKYCHILRAVPGAGKSTLAKVIAGENGVICEADYFMYENGEYKWHPTKVKMAHSKCFDKFKNACDDGLNVVVSNTNTTEKEFGKYKEYAEKLGYTVFVTIIENRHSGVNTHDVPEDKLELMKNRILGDIKLC